MLRGLLLLGPVVELLSLFPVTLNGGDWMPSRVRTDVVPPDGIILHVIVFWKHRHWRRGLQAVHSNKLVGGSCDDEIAAMGISNSIMEFLLFSFEERAGQRKVNLETCF